MQASIREAQIREAITVMEKLQIGKECQNRISGRGVLNFRWQVDSR